MSRPSLRKAAQWGVAIVLATLMGFGLTHFVSLLHHIETRTQDIRQAGFAQPQPTDERIVVAAINEDTLAKFPYRSPVDRQFLAELLNTLQQKGAKAIYLDVLLDQPTEPNKDALLHATLRDLKVPMAVGYTVAKEVLNEEQQHYLNEFVPAHMRAAVNLATDPFDGTVRWIYPGTQSQDEPPSVPYRLQQLLGSTVPATADWPTIDWRRPPDADNLPFAVYPSHMLQAMPDAWLQNKVVLVGAVLSITDRHRTPYAIYGEDRLGMMSGVEVFAHQISQMLDQRQVPLMSVPVSVGITFVAAVLAGLLAAWRKSIVITLTASLVLLLSYWWLAFTGYVWGMPMLPLLAPTLAFALGLFAVDFILGKEDRDKRKFIQTAFSRYLAPTVVQQLIDHPESLSVTGKNRQLSFIFTDIAGFTTLSEQIAPERLSELLNAYLEGMCDIIQSYQGVVDKFIGDSVMCFFNAPLDQLDHADRAIACALALDQFAENFRQKIKEQGLDLGMTRIGIHSGQAVVGNFGSTARMDFTALGDTVNAASRTEGVNKYFGTRLCVTEATLALCTQEDIHVRPIGHIQLKGKHNAVTLFEPVTADFAQSTLCQKYLHAYELMDAGDVQALAAFQSLVHAFPDDPLAQFHLDRLTKGAVGAKVTMGDK
jgi:adenylate cyclase